MEISGVANTQYTADQSILKSANKQPQLAGDLIARTVQAIAETQPAQAKVQPVQSAAGGAGSGNIGNSIDIRV